MNNNFLAKEMTENQKVYLRQKWLKSSRANYIFISDNGFIKRNCYFFKQHIQIISAKWTVNIEHNHLHVLFWLY